jgi:putative iron-regulated protein
MKLNSKFRAAVLAIAPAALLALPAQAATDASAVVKHYAEVAHAKYEDSLTTAKALDTAIDAFLKTPTDETLKAARDAWIKARVPYQQTEVYRFGNPIVDDWEGKVNAWPLDEGTESDENSLYVANVIANKTIKIDGKDVDASKLTPEFLSGTLAEAGGIEANVATGYHAIEFLLWGQDLNGTGPGAGNRPATDYDLKNCTHGNCDRRISEVRLHPARFRPHGNGRQLEAGRGCNKERRSRSEGRPRRDPDRHGFTLLWRACRRAHEARPAAARSGRRA